MIYIINKNKTKITPAINKIEIVKDGALWAIVCGQERIAYYLNRKEAVKDMQKNAKKLERGIPSISFEGMEFPKINCENCPNCIERKGQLKCKLKGKVKTKCFYIFSPDKIISLQDLNKKENQVELDEKVSFVEEEVLKENINVNEENLEVVLEQNNEVENDNDSPLNDNQHKKHKKHKNKKHKHNNVDTNEETEEHFEEEHSEVETNEHFEEDKETEEHFEEVKETEEQVFIEEEKGVNNEEN